jgi:hypothetical protein
MAMLATTAENSVQLTVGGAIIMTVSVLLVLGLVIFCMTHILREKEPRKHRAPLEIDTRDLNG